MSEHYVASITPDDLTCACGFNVSHDRNDDKAARAAAQAMIEHQQTEAVRVAIADSDQLRDAWLGSDVRDLKQQLEASRADVASLRAQLAEAQRERDEARRLAHDRAVLWDMAISERDGRDHVIAAITAERDVARAEVVSLRADLANTARGIAPFNSTEFGAAIQEAERETAEQIGTTAREVTSRERRSFGSRKISRRTPPPQRSSRRPRPT